MQLYKGLHREKQHLQSTSQVSQKIVTEDTTEDNFPPSPSPNNKVNEVCYILIDRKKFLTAYQDLTGRFPVRSSQGNEYILVGYHYDANYILGIPVRNWSVLFLCVVWQKIGLVANVFVEIA